MASDVMENPIEEEGRYRGMDLDENAFDENDKDSTEYDTAKETSDRKLKSTEIGTSTSFMQQTINDQARTITKIQETNAELRQEITRTNIEEVEKLRKTITEQGETIIKLQDELKKRNIDNGESTEDAGNDAKKRKRGDLSDVMNMAMVADSFDKDEKIRELTDEIQVLKTELHKQKSQTTSSSKKGKPTVADKQTEAKTQMQPNRPTPNVESLFQEMQSKLDHQMVQMKEFIQTSIDEKLEKHINKSQTMTYASKAASGVQKQEGNELRSFMLEAKNAEIVIANERQRRENNIVIHGVKENAELPEEQRKQMDDTFITALLLILGVNAKPKSTTRLGKIVDNVKIRPLKMVMSSIDDKKPHYVTVVKS